MKNLAKLSVVFLVIGSVVGLAWANSAVNGDDWTMMASPSTIVLNKVDTVTVHTNIPASEVASGTLALNGVASICVCADNLGHITAKFAVADLGLVAGDEVLLTLTGAFEDGTPFSPTDVVRVR